MRWIVIVGAALALAGCGEPKRDLMADRLEAAESNARRAYMRTEELGSRVSELEEKVQRLEANQM
ncbi:MAG: hypothetical protein Q8K11_16630 [Phenylobacterium sp.]|uniref:hypothetical protein n=1 Tax=Phenylobacterium sp. TaxID=1871053 RepID=UPI00272F7547|nr:hypothetical protein [Phenylobacterium sp.]MDP2011800.1 hypothetical protein [Phenylobacterium sp.]